VRRITAEVDPVLEITEITDRITRAAPSLLFEHPRFAHTLLINMLGTERRMNLALEVSKVEEVADRIRGLLELQPRRACSGKSRCCRNSPTRLIFSKDRKDGPARK